MFVKHCPITAIFFFLNLTLIFDLSLTDDLGFFSIEGLTSRETYLTYGSSVTKHWRVVANVWIFFRQRQSKTYMPLIYRNVAIRKKDWTLSHTDPAFYVSSVELFLKTLWEKEKLLVISNFSFYHSVFYHFGDLPAIFIKFEIVICKLFQIGRV